MFLLCQWLPTELPATAPFIIRVYFCLWSTTSNEPLTLLDSVVAPTSLLLPPTSAYSTVFYRIIGFKAALIYVVD